MSDWTYETAEDLEKPLAERLRAFPREPDMTVYALRSLAALALRGWLRAYHRLEIVGAERLPREGSFVMVANHASHLDTLSMLSAVPLAKRHRAFPAAAADYFFRSLPRSAVSAIFVNALPFHRKVRSDQSLNLCRALLSNPGNILILFPEGTRSVSGEIAPFRPGIGLLLAGTEIPAVPCRLFGAREAWPKGAAIPRPKKIRLVIGEPRAYASTPKSRAGALEIAEDLRSAVLSLQ